MATVLADLEIDEFKFVIDVDSIPVANYLALLNGLKAEISRLTNGSADLHVLGVHKGSIVTWLRIVAARLDIEPSGKRVAQAAVFAAALTAFQFAGQIMTGLTNTFGRTPFATVVDELMNTTDAKRIVIETDRGTFTYTRAEHDERQSGAMAPVVVSGSDLLVLDPRTIASPSAEPNMTDTGTIRASDDHLLFESAQGYSIPIQRVEAGVVVTYDVPCRIRARTVEQGGLHLLSVDII